MEKSYVINRIKELCNKKNDREIALDFFYNNRIFHAKYLFLGNDLYVTKKRNNRSYSFCTPSGIRTLDPLIKSQLLYQLS